MIELLHNALSDGNIIDTNMINNVRIRTRKKKLELDYANIDMDHKVWHYIYYFVSSILLYLSVFID